MNHHGSIKVSVESILRVDYDFSKSWTKDVITDMAYESNIFVCINKYSMYLSKMKVVIIP